jgi:thiol-disulfide isomerase/thioredoxin
VTFSEPRATGRWASPAADGPVPEEPRGRVSTTATTHGPVTFILVKPSVIRRAAASCLLGAMVLAGCSSGSATGAARVPADQLTATLALPFERFDGGTTTLDAYTGRPVVLNFFASWCTTCVTEMPDFEAVHQELGDRIAMVGINVLDRPADGEAVAARTGVTYDLGRDPQASIFNGFGTLGMPTTIFLRADGTVAASHTGALNRRQLLDKIRTELGVT